MTVVDSRFYVMMGIALLLLTTPVSAQTAPTPASNDGAQDAPDPEVEARARLHFRSGAAHYDAGNYQSALNEFREAYELSHRPQLYYNLSLCYRNLGDMANAVDYMQRYLSEVEDVPERDMLEERLRNMIQVRDQQAAENAAREEQLANAEAAREAAEAASRSDNESSGMLLGAISGFAVGGVGLLTGVIFGAMTINQHDDLAGNCAASGCPNTAIDEMRTYALVADIGFLLAIVGAGVGTTLLLLDMNDDNETQATILPWATPTGGGISAVGSF